MPLPVFGEGFGILFINTCDSIIWIAATRWWFQIVLLGQVKQCLRVTAPTRCVRQDRWFQLCLIFTPNHGGNDPIWRAYFSDGLKPSTRQELWVLREYLKCKTQVRGWGYSIVGYVQGISDGSGSSIGTELESTPLDYWQNTRISHGPHGLDVYPMGLMFIPWAWCLAGFVSGFIVKHPEKWWLRIQSISPKSSSKETCLASWNKMFHLEGMTNMFLQVFRLTQF